MKKIFRLCALLVALTGILNSKASDTLFVWNANQPVVIGRRHNIVLDCKYTTNGIGHTINAIEMELVSETKEIKRIEAYYTGTTSMLNSRTTSNALHSHQSMYGGGQKLYAHPAYAILKATKEHPQKNITLKPNLELCSGTNYFYISAEVTDQFKLTDKFSLKIVKAVIDGKEATISTEGIEQPVRVGVSVRDYGDDDVFSYRIPGIVTTKDGTLVSVFDIRRYTSSDLQEDIQIGVCRSTDGGRTWDKMITAMDMRGTGGLPDSQNGTGDPSILVNPKTGELFIMALWTHGIGGAASWWNCKQGINYTDGAAQVLIVRSSDDGQTWSKPQNITPQIKDSSWFILLQGPGCGITTDDGTIIFPFQYKDEKDMPASTIIYSKDNGNTWTVGSRARENTTESQVIQLGNGDLMLNMRDNRGGSRAVMTTSDLGKTWKDHSSNRKSLIEPVCMASLIRVKAEENILGKDILLFSNPNTTDRRSYITIKASLDEGNTWDDKNSVMLDAENGWGYSCLTMIDRETVGIFYESSKAHLIFQAVKIKDIIKE